MTLPQAKIDEFRAEVWEYFRRYGRVLPWRENPQPYYVLVSELMLQQTQVPRVIPKFNAFIATFPDVATLAASPLSDVLRLWSGLGYNRRAKYLHQAAQAIVTSGSKFPDTYDGLVALPGVGQNTAGAILAYAYNQPVVYIETNIRTVYLHHFFADSTDLVGDAELHELVAQTLDTEHPREWYAALMDYGTHLKATAGGRLTQSRHYKKQAPLKGSLREMRGRILKQLATNALTEEVLRAQTEADDRFDFALEALEREGFVEKVHDRWCLTGYREHS